MTTLVEDMVKKSLLTLAADLRGASGVYSSADHRQLMNDASQILKELHWRVEAVERTLVALIEKSGMSSPPLISLEQQRPPAPEEVEKLKAALARLWLYASPLSLLARGHSRIEVGCMKAR